MNGKLELEALDTTPSQLTSLRVFKQSSFHIVKFSCSLICANQCKSAKSVFYVFLSLIVNRKLNWYFLKIVRACSRLFAAKYLFYRDW